MGTVLFDFLTESFLFDSEHLEAEFATISEAQIELELSKYRKFSLGNMNTLLREATASSSILRVFAGVAQIPVRTLMQSALYIEQYVLQDPLFSLTSNEPAGADAFRTLVGAPGGQVNRRAVANAVRYLRALTPMVAANYVKLLPVSYQFEPPGQLPLRYSENGFDDVLPSELMDLYRRKAVVRPIQPHGKGWIVSDDLVPCRSICIQFDGAGDDSAYLEHLVEQKVLRVDDGGGTFSSILRFPEDVPQEELFNAWVRQSVNKAAQHSHSRVLTEFTLARELSASYLSTSQLAFDALEQTGRGAPGQRELSASTLLKLELPFLDKIDMETLMTVRKNEADAFQAFRGELDKQFAELRLETDPSRFQAKAQKIVVDLSETQPGYLRIKARELQRGALSQTLMHTAVLAGAMWATALTPFTPLAAAGSLAKAYYDYRAAIRPNPSYFLWKVLEG